MFYSLFLILLIWNFCLPAYLRATVENATNKISTLYLGFKDKTLINLFVVYALSGYNHRPFPYPLITSANLPSAAYYRPKAYVYPLTVTNQESTKNPVNSVSFAYELSQQPANSLVSPCCSLVSRYRKCCACCTTPSCSETCSSQATACSLAELCITLENGT